MKIALGGIAALALLAGPSAGQQVRVRETAGLARTNEPVTVKLTGQGPAQVYFVTIGAGQTRTFSLAGLKAPAALRVEQTDPVGFVVDNGVFTADLSKRVVNGQEEDSGTLRALTFRTPPGAVKLLRTQNRMHWAPSFQRTGARGYTSMALWTPVQRVKQEKGPGWLRFTREGHHHLYPEIKLRAEYEFYAGAPYFLFDATMTVASAIDMFWLRGQEMTMDDLFTHVIVPDRDGRPRVMTFEERKPVLAKEPLPADAWVAFVNLEKGYGFGAAPLGYTATRETNAHLSIDDGAGHGKYWDRHIISRQATPLKPGDRFTERTAFVLFTPQPGAPAAPFLAWRDRLLKPLKIEAVR